MASNKPTNYDEYIDDLMDNCTLNSYGKIQSVGAFKVADKVKVVVEWAPELKRTKAKIIGFGKRGNKIFAEISWSDKSLFNKYGSLFSIDELIKV